jgi:hypothetical protein
MKRLFMLATVALSVFSGMAQSSEGPGAEGSLRLAIPDSSRLQIITTNDGSRNVGRIIVIGSDSIDFRTDMTTVRIPISGVVSITEVATNARKSGKIWFENPNITRLFFAPTGRMLKKGEGYFSDYYLFFPGFSYGLSDRVTVGGGMSLFPGMNVNEQLFFVTPKVGLMSSEFVHVALGALVMRIPSDDGWDEDPKGAGILYGVATWGSADASITAGAGFGFVGGNLAEKPMIMLGGEKRMTRTLALVTENWIFPGVDNPLISYGFRFFGERMSIDLGFLNMLGEHAVFPGVPYVDFVIKF